MGKLIVRITIVLTSLYLLASYIAAQFFGVDILNDFRCIPFELCVVVYAYSEGRYHCKYLKHLSLCILLADVITSADNIFNFMSIEAHNLIPMSLLALGFLTLTCKAFKHFYKVRRQYGRRKIITD